MALQFPTNPVVSQTYQSGSSATYQFNGEYWTVISPPTQTYVSFPASSLRKNITKIETRGYNGGLIVADGKIFTFNGTEGNTNYTRGTYLSTGDDASGLLNTREVVFPGESGSLVDAGMRSSQGYALFDNGNLWMWGFNGQGQLGVGDTTNRFLPVLSTTNVSKIYTHIAQDSRNTGYSHYFILKRDGKVYGTGYNGFGQLGIAADTTDRSTWTEITSFGTNPKNVWPLGAYTGCTFVEKSDGSIWVCGYNSYGQLGIGNTTQTISTLTNTNSAWNGGDNTMRIQEIGFGGGYVDANTIENENICLFMDNGTTSKIMSAGSNDWGTLGDGTQTLRSTPVAPVTFTGRVQKMARVGAQPGSIWLLKTDGTLWNLGGYNGTGQLGRGNFTSPLLTNAQVDSNVLDLLLPIHCWYGWGYQAASPIVVKADGYYRCGANGYGAVGDGTLTNRNTLTKMRFPAGLSIKLVGAIGAQINDVLTFYAIDTDNKLWAWGSNGAYGITSVGAANHQGQPIWIQPTALLK